MYSTDVSPESTTCKIAQQHPPETSFTAFRKLPMNRQLDGQQEITSKKTLQVHSLQMSSILFLGLVALNI